MHNEELHKGAMFGAAAAVPVMEYAATNAGKDAAYALLGQAKALHALEKGTALATVSGQYAATRIASNVIPIAKALTRGYERDAKKLAQKIENLK